MSEQRWIRFDEGPSKSKTKTWFVVNKESGEAIGEIKWYGAFRKYSFFPFIDTVYEQTCLTDISKFLAEQMANRKVQP